MRTIESGQPDASTGVLAALARGVLGDGYAAAVPERILERLNLFPPPDRKKLSQAIGLLGRPLGALALTGRPTPVSKLSPDQAEALLQRWQHSRIGAKSQLATALVALSLGALYGYPGPEWNRIGYPGPLGPPPDEPKRLQPLEISSHQELTCDVVVVGSGAGGGCVAGRLAEAGLDVVVLEKGGYRSESDFDHREPESLSHLYLYAGSLTTTDLSAVIIAGSTLGGGTVVNYTTSFQTPDYVLREWSAETGIEAFVSGEFEESLDQVAVRVGVNTHSSNPGIRDQLMAEGLEKLGWHADVLPRAVRGCLQDDECGYCGFGCRVGAKQSTMRTFLEDAAGHGARMVVNANVRRVLIKDGVASGVVASVGGRRLVVKARAVVAAGGSIETPALLLRSGLAGQVGRNLHLHPGTGAFGVFDEPVRPWTGTTQARYSSQFRHLDGDWGALFETVPIHPGLGSGALPWVSAKQHRDLMGRFANLGVCGVAPRDRTSGRVTVASDGTPRVRYKLRDDDERMIVQALISAGKVMEAAGAKEIFTLHTSPLSYQPTAGGHERWAEQVRRTGFRGKATAFSYHQMGSCRMGTDPGTSAIGPDNETQEVKDLFVADASAFPSASGVNPMLTVYAIADRAARKIAARLS
jgi:long-chain-alcohol oxidase